MNAKFIHETASAVTTVALLATVFAGFPISKAQAADTGLLSPTTNASDGATSWSNPTNAYANAGGSASNVANEDRHRYGGFSLPAIPSGAVVTGVEVIADTWAEDNDCALDVDISWNNGTNFSAEKEANIGTTESTETLGGSNDTWGHAWTVAELSNLLVRVQANDADGIQNGSNDCQAANDDVFVDWLRARIHYVVPAYSISGSAVVNGSTLDLSGTSGANPQKGADGTQHMAVDWDEDQDGDPDTGTGWEVAPAGGLSFTPTFAGSQPSRSFTDNWSASNVYSNSGAYTVRVMVYHGNTPGEDGDALATHTFDVVITPPSQCSDGVDNADPEDVLVDVNDPGCWTDPNNANTYNPNDTDETTPADMCPNDAGIQVSDTQCTPDACTNIDGFQGTVPQGYETLSPGICTLIPVDACPADEGFQATGPCQSDDVCPNNVGIQTDVNQCTPDACTNIADFQATVPQGYETLSPGICTLISVETDATVYFSKVICDAEEFLPNWGNGGPAITADTAENYVTTINSENNGQVCQPAEWNFQWAPDGTKNPGDNVEEAEGDWMTITGLSLSIPNPNGATFWFREVIPSNYLPFSGSTSEPYDDVSAEFYCGSDVLNYDNYDFISGVDAGEDFYCVGFNVQENPPLPVCSDDKDNDGDQLIDELDPACHFDGNPENPDSYNSDGDSELTCEEGYHVENNECVPNQDSGNGTLVIVKQVLNASEESLYDFDFDIESINGSYDLDVPVSNGVENENQIVLPAGTYEVTETVPEGWTLSSEIVCEYDEVSFGTSIENGKEVTVAKDETVICTFVNRMNESSSQEVDLCANIDGVQTEKPKGKQIVDGDQCIDQGRSGGSRGEPGGSSGQVLGATSCGPLLTEYLHIGWNNSSSEVTKLQEFLNEHLGLTLPVSGLFGQETEGAVKNFQVKYGNSILTPWIGVPASGIDNENDPTGFVYQTTRWQINNIFCPGSEAFPETLN